MCVAVIPLFLSISLPPSLSLSLLHSNRRLVSFHSTRREDKLVNLKSFINYFLSNFFCVKHIQVVRFHLTRMASNEKFERATDERKEILTFLLNFTNTILYRRHHVKNQRESDWPLLKLPLIVLEQYFIIKVLIITSVTRFINFSNFWQKFAQTVTEPKSQNIITKAHLLSPKNIFAKPFWKLININDKPCFYFLI